MLVLKLECGGDDVRSREDLEEERRLFYVGVTRGIEKVSISYANSRRRFGSGPMFSLRSSFIDSIPEELCSYNSDSKPSYVGRTLFSDRKQSNKKVLINKDSEFAVNDMVQHKLYGNGKITNIEGIGDNSKITIQFRGNIVKKFIKKYANLKNIN